jgi:imidazolonepropionase-like amidohydrolase
MKNINSKLAWLFLALLVFQVAVFGQEYSIIHAGKIFDSNTKQVLEQKTIVIQQGKFSRIESGYLTLSQMNLSSESVDVIDLKDKFLLPGFIDMHVHITDERNPDENPHEWTTLNESDAAFKSIPFLKNTLYAGFTTVRDLGADHKLIGAIKRSIQKKYIDGPRIIAATSAISATGGHGDFHGYRTEIEEAMGHNVAICDGSDDCRRAVRAVVKQGADVIKITATGGVLSNTAAGVGKQLTDDELITIVETARSLGRKVAAHAHQADGINAALRAGVNSIEHGSYLNDESVKLFVEKGAYLVPTLLAGVWLTEEMEINLKIPPAIVAKIKEVTPMVEASFKRALKGGVNIAFGTDSGVSKHGTNAREFELMVKYGMSEADAIVSATKNAAELLGMENQIGTIEVGKWADIVAVSGNPLKDISLLKNVEFVMKEGKVFK